MNLPRPRRRRGESPCGRGTCSPGNRAAAKGRGRAEHPKRPPGLVPLVEAVQARPRQRQRLLGVEDVPQTPPRPARRASSGSNAHATQSSLGHAGAPPTTRDPLHPWARLATTSCTSQKAGLPLWTDCSGDSSPTATGPAGTPDPSGLDYQYVGFTGTLLENAQKPRPHPLRRRTS
jgi:hypothetical protein